MKLNLGCGNDYRYDKDWVNLDLKRPCNVLGDIECGLPFKRASFGTVWASHVLEHIRNLKPLKRELARILEPQGILEVTVPYYLSPDAWGDDTHCRAFSRQSFLDTFWPGFHLMNIEIMVLKKAETGEEVTWVRAKMMRTHEFFKTIKNRFYQHLQ